MTYNEETARPTSWRRWIAQFTALAEAMDETESSHLAKRVALLEREIFALRAHVGLGAAGPHKDLGS